MNAHDVIESYVTDVVVQLPRRQRGDVAFELRALLDEELQARAASAGRNADPDMAAELIRTFGRPADVAARYRAPLTIIDPADGRAFLQAAAIGVAILWVLGLIASLQQPVDSGGDVLTALGGWWTRTVIPSLWWPGLLVTCFGTAAWIRRRWPQTAEWKPRARDLVHGNRTAMVMGLIGTVCGLVVLIEPRRLLDLFFGGRAAPAAYQALTYAETFRQRQGPYVLAVVALNVPTLITAIVHGRWPATLRHTRLWQSLVLCAVLAWTVLDGPILMTPVSDRAVKFALVIIIASTLVGIGLKVHRSVRPAPGPVRA